MYIVDLVLIATLLCYVVMQAFSKIHDEYQFPTRLDLTKFVASEEQEGGAGAGAGNTYILHSVLVHSVRC